MFTDKELSAIAQSMTDIIMEATIKMDIYSADEEVVSAIVRRMSTASDILNKLDEIKLIKNVTDAELFYSKTLDELVIVHYNEPLSPTENKISMEGKDFFMDSDKIRLLIAEQELTHLGRIEL